VRRLASGALAILGVTILVFGFLHLVPGDPIDNLAGGEATPEQRAKLEHCLGLDESAVTQLTTFLGHVADGTLGHQCPLDPEHERTVAARIASVMPHTIALAIAGMLVAIVLALPLGVLAAVRRGTWIDTVATVTALSGIAHDCGLDAFPLVTQSQFLVAIGEETQFADAFEECKLPQEQAKVALQLKHLATPVGMGDIFHVLVQSRGVQKEKAARLDGLKFAREIPSR